MFLLRSGFSRPSLRFQGSVSPKFFTLIPSFRRILSRGGVNEGEQADLLSPPRLRVRVDAGIFPVLLIPSRSCADFLPLTFVQFAHPSPLANPFFSIFFPVFPGWPLFFVFPPEFIVSSRLVTTVAFEKSYPPNRPPFFPSAGIEFQRPTRGTLGPPLPPLTSA